MKNPFIAFLLAFFPGGGLLYLGKFRGLFYTLTGFGIPLFSFILGTYSNFFLIFAFGGLLMYIINFIDTVITAGKYTRSADHKSNAEQPQSPNMESERFFTIVLSLIPGLGHFQLGLMNRGLTLLVSFFGLGTMIVFVTGLSHRGEFLIFLALLPVIWVYSFFDAMQLLNKKQSGETLVDRSILEDFEARREDGKKSKAIATLLSIFPGAGHLYLGLQQRGIQLMAAFLFSIYILDVLHLGIFLFIIPIIWFYSFFDSLQMTSKYDTDPLEDKPLITQFIHKQKWIGIALIALGFYYLFTNLLLPIFAPIVQQQITIDLTYWFGRYFQMAVVCLLLIGGGLKLMLGSKEKSTKKESSE